MSLPKGSLLQDRLVLLCCFNRTVCGYHFWKRISSDHGRSIDQVIYLCCPKSWRSHGLSFLARFDI